MGKVYSILLGFCALVLTGTATAQCTNTPGGAGPCTGGNVTRTFNGGNGGFTSTSTFTYNSGSGYWNSPGGKNAATRLLQLYLPCHLLVVIWDLV